MKKNKGFTLIELLVVIAIIGILASVVLASLNSARKKGANAQIKSQMASARSQANIFFNLRTDTPYSYIGVCGTGDMGGQKPIGLMLFAALKSGGFSVNQADYSSNFAEGGEEWNGGGLSVNCNNSPTAWAATVPLKESTGGSPKMWCIDSKGNSKQYNSDLGFNTNCD
jgi:prepilin-type N-terminal cleavage/methylation domain-containing protein